MAKGKGKGEGEHKQRLKGMDLIGEDLLQKILSKLPALSFAYAACVSHSWNSVCSRVLSRPKLSSALSLNASLSDATREVLDKVLSEPIRPHFAIASISPSFSLKQAHELITQKLGSRIPVITSVSNGIMGREALTDEFKEIQWEITEDVHTSTSDCGIILTIGCLPGLQVNIISLPQSNREPRGYMIDKFVMDIREYTASVSGCASPAGIILFADQETDMKPVLEKMDYAMSQDIVIVGDEGGQFLYSSDSGRRTSRSQSYSSAAVALLFSRERDKPSGVGETQFHVAIAAGVSPIGPTYKAVSVRDNSDSTWLTARREGFHENLDGQTILTHIYDDMGDRFHYSALYVGFTKRRKCSIGLDKVRWITSRMFHEVLGGDEEYLYVDGAVIKTGDCFRFYYSDANMAASSCSSVSEHLGQLKQDCDDQNHHHVRGVAASGSKKEVFGGFIFCCCGRGDSFFGRPIVDSSPFLENFPGVTLAGTFRPGEIGRGDLSSYGQESQEQSYSEDLIGDAHATWKLALAVQKPNPSPTKQNLS